MFSSPVIILSRIHASRREAIKDSLGKTPGNTHAIYLKTTKDGQICYYIKDSEVITIRKRAEKKPDKETIKQIPRYYAYLSAVSIMNKRVIVRFLLPCIS